MLPLVVIIGPTAVGKTKLSVDLALKIDGEIISGDSMQVYRHMSIGTAKVRTQEMRGITHHLLDILEPDEPFSTAAFQTYADCKIKEIVRKGRIPIIAGGTGLYIQSVVDSYDFQPQQDTTEYRRELLAIADTKGKEYLHQMLEEVDPTAAKKIHHNDVKRTARALEYYHYTGKKISDKAGAQKGKGSSKYQTVMIGLTMARKNLYERINKRVDNMMEDGFLNELKILREMGYSPDLPAMQSLGYKQLNCYLDGKYDLETAVALIKRDSRRFAKRQMTWFGKDSRINWFNVDRYQDCSQLLPEIIAIIGRTINIGVEYDS